MARKLGYPLAGVVLLVVGIVLQVHYGPQHALCMSPLGQSAQTFSQGGESIAGLPNCGLASTLSTLSWICIATGIVGLLIGGLELVQRRKRSAAS
ncbi:MAG TPA: hypothetical protein VHI52_10720 [Verrucomicrobiae bacterium]|nr:hypothetical protein [Verrucomicrobiae bacterium]